MRHIKMITVACALTLGLHGCGGRDFALLQPGQGPGTYAGTLTGGGAGSFDLRIRDSGQISGSGTLGAFEIELRGVLQPDGALVGFITERASQRSGEFNGQLAGTQLSGDWTLDPTGQLALAGDWAAALKP